MGEPRTGIDGLFADLERLRPRVAPRSPPYGRALAELPQVLRGAPGRYLAAAWSHRTFHVWWDRPLLLLAALRHAAMLEGEGHPLFAAFAASSPRAEAVTAARALCRARRQAGADVRRAREPRGADERDVARRRLALARRARGALERCPPGGARRRGRQRRPEPRRGRLAADVDGRAGRAARDRARDGAVARLGLDPSPLDATKEDDADWIRACVSPGDGARLVRLEAAFAAFRQAYTRPDAPVLAPVAAAAVPARLDVLSGARSQRPRFRLPDRVAGLPRARGARGVRGRDARLARRPAAGSGALGGARGRRGGREPGWRRGNRRAHARARRWGAGSGARALRLPPDAGSTGGTRQSAEVAVALVREGVGGAAMTARPRLLASAALPRGLAQAAASAEWGVQLLFGGPLNLRTPLTIRQGGERDVHVQAAMDDAAVREPNLLRGGRLPARRRARVGARAPPSQALPPGPAARGAAGSRCPTATTSSSRRTGSSSRAGSGPASAPARWSRTRRARCAGARSMRTGSSATGTVRPGSRMSAGAGSSQLCQLAAVQCDSHRLLEQNGGKVRGVPPERRAAAGDTGQRVTRDPQVPAGRYARVRPCRIRPRGRHGRNSRCDFVEAEARFGWLLLDHEEPPIALRDLFERQVEADVCDVWHKRSSKHGRAQIGVGRRSLSLRPTARHA